MRAFSSAAVCLSLATAFLPALAASAQPAPATGGTKLGILPFEGSGVAPDELFSIESTLRGELSRRSDLALQPRDETIGHVQGARALGVVCMAGDLTCLARLGELAAVDKVLVGKVTESPGSYALEISIVEVATKTEERKIVETISSARDARINEVRRVSTRLFAPEEVVGALMINVNKPNATILIDGVRVGQSPLQKPIEGLSPGKHSVEVRLGGHRAYQGYAQVQFGQVANLDVAMVSITGDDDVPVDGGPLEQTEIMTGGPVEQPDDELSVLPIALLGAGGAAALTGIVLVAVGAGSYAYAWNAAQNPPAGLAPGDFAERQQIATYVTIGGLAVGAVAIVGGAASATASFFVE